MMTPLDVAKSTLKNWIWQGKHASTDNFDLFIEEGDRPFVRLRFNTVTNSYGIRAVPPNDKDKKGYLACEFSAREPNPGETWTRGGDLSDGSFSKDTWDRIIMDILSVELAEAAERTEV